MAHKEPAKDVDDIRMTLHIDGKAQQFTPRHSIEFLCGLSGEPIPVLHISGVRVRQPWTLVARIHKAAEKQ